MRSSNRSHRKLQALGAIAILSACNGLLSNDPRLLDLEDGVGGEAGQHAGGDVHAAGTSSEAGTPDGGSNDNASRPGEGGGGLSSGDPGIGGEMASGAQSAGGEAQILSCLMPGACTPGATASEDVACGACDAGKATRTRTCQSDCVWGAWSSPGECRISVACEPGQVGMQTEHCGACNTGTHAQTRTCTSSCTWGAWGAWGTCTGVTGACTAGETQTRSAACPCSGNKNQKRTCSSSCAWGGWTDTSSCDLECCSEIVYCDTPDNISPASRGTWCRSTDSDCSDAEVSSDCMADIKTVCGSVVPQLYIEY